ncbi:MAG: transglycosylase SLT domain-containing protein [Acidimicrobiales bacterium]
MRLAPKRAGLRVGTYLLGGLAVGAALIALLPSNEQRVGLSSIASEATVLTPADPASAETTATSETTAATSATSSSATPSESTSTSVAEPDEPADPSQLALPTNAAEFSLAIEQAERMVRDEALSNPQRDGWGRRQQSLYRHLTSNSEWADEILAGVDPTLTNAVSLNWGARQSLSSLVNTEHLQSELPAWRVIPPLPPEELIGYYKQAEADTGIQWEFLAAINLIETRMGRIQGISTAGAVGPMQFLPTTWAECCEGDPAVPADAIAGAAKYLTDRGGPENMNRAIFGYNNSQYYVDAVTAYANVMMEDERAYYGYHAWEIYFLSTEGLIRIPVGYEQLEPIAAATWLAENPESLFTP